MARQFVYVPFCAFGGGGGHSESSLYPATLHLSILGAQTRPVISPLLMVIGVSSNLHPVAGLPSV